ncbi:MAG: hypothetical protein E7480_02445 [Ruminococcaceae bacterium]|nr:hypothetical protein [Oscillospiraceae bacterium]
MKKVYVLFLYIIILFLLTGCYSGLKSETAKGNQKQETKNIFYIKPDKTELQKLLYKAKKLIKTNLQLSLLKN